MDDVDDVDELEWLERSRRVALERVALALASGVSVRDRLVVSADPVVPDDEDPLAVRRFFVEGDELVHGPGGVVTGVRRVRWELSLSRVGVVDGACGAGDGVASGG
jgi:hypothetical protein